VLVPPVEHDAYVSVLAEKERTKVLNIGRLKNEVVKVEPSRMGKLNLDRDKINFLMLRLFYLGAGSSGL